MEKLYTIKEACEILRISRSTIFRMAKEGRINFTHISKKVVVIKESDIIRIMGER